MCKMGGQEDARGLVRARLGERQERNLGGESLRRREEDRYIRTLFLGQVDDGTVSQAVA